MSITNVAASGAIATEEAEVEHGLEEDNDRDASERDGVDAKECNDCEREELETTSLLLLLCRE